MFQWLRKYFATPIVFRNVRNATPSTWCNIKADLSLPGLVPCLQSHGEFCKSLNIYWHAASDSLQDGKGRPLLVWRLCAFSGTLTDIPGLHVWLCTSISVCFPLCQRDTNTQDYLHGLDQFYFYQCISQIHFRENFSFVIALNITACHVRKVGVLMCVWDMCVDWLVCWD